MGSTSHIAIFEAVNAVDRTHATYRDLQKKIYTRSGLPNTITPDQASKRHAIAYAAYGTLVELYPSQKSTLDVFLQVNLTQLLQVPKNVANAGYLLGEASARAILDERKNDGSELPDPPVSTVATSDPSKWQRDPLNEDPNVALGRNWSLVKPFVIAKAEAHRPSVPPQYRAADGSVNADYVLAFEEVLNKGGDPLAGLSDPPGLANRRPTPTTRTNDEEITGKFWAYDATALLCAPPRLYNMIATSVALKERRATFTNGTQLARYLAIINVALADAGLAAWEAKYYYFYPRPVTAIRAAQVGNSPLTEPRPFWTPLGAPVTNAQAGRVNFSPPFPAYPSGHAVFGAALFEVLRKHFGADDKIEFVSDEYNGLNSDPGSSTPRPLIPQEFTYSGGEELNGQSRIFLGIHWKFDKTEGITQGKAVATDVLAQLYP